MTTATQTGKKEMVRDMFNGIAPRYDFLNHVLSVGIDILWRKKAIRQIAHLKPQIMLDVATGTGDFALEALSLKPKQIIGIDISEGMLDLGRIKVKNRKVDDCIQLLVGDSEDMPFADNNFDAITVGFGVRNFADINKGLHEMHRVLKPKGMLVVLEFSKPKTFPIKQVYQFYFSFILPLVGRLISKHSIAYTYLPDSVEKFPEGQTFLEMMKKNGFVEVRQIPLTFGIASLYLGNK